MRIPLTLALLFSVGHCELCTSKFSITPPSSIAPHDSLDVRIDHNHVTVSYDSDRFSDETQVLNLMKTLTNSVVTSLHETTCDPCDLCDYCTYDPLYDNTYGTGGAHHNFLCADATNCKGCDLVQSYMPDACDLDQPVHALFPSTVAFSGWNATFKESCPHRCAEQLECTLKCPHSQHTVNLHLLFDDTPSETYWQMFHNDTKVVISQGGYYTSAIARKSIQVTSCVDSGCYGITLVDSGYNGMPNGSYRVNVDGTDVISEHGEFNFSRVESFCIRQPEAPTRMDVADPPPPPGSVQTYTVGFSFVAKGSIADFDANRISALKMKCSESTGVPASNISIEVSAASVNIVTTFSITGVDQATQLETTLIAASTVSQQGIDDLFGGEVESETLASSVSFDQVVSYCSCKSEWTYPCTDGVARNGCDQNSCGAPSHARYCPATDASCTPNPNLQNSAAEAFQNTGDEFVFWCSPSCVDDPNGAIQGQGWGSTGASACANLVESFQTSHSKTREETCSTDLSDPPMGVLVKHYCPVACVSVSPLCPTASPPPVAGAVLSSSSPPPTTNVASPPPTIPPESGGDDDDDDEGSDTVLLVVAIILGVLVVIGGVAIALQKSGTVDSVEVDVSSALNATVTRDVSPNLTVKRAKIQASTEKSRDVTTRDVTTRGVTTRGVTTGATQSPVQPGASTKQISLTVQTATPPVLTSLPRPTSLPPPSVPPLRPPPALQSSVNQMLVPSRVSPRRSRSRSPRRG